MTKPLNTIDQLTHDLKPVKLAPKPSLVFLPVLISTFIIVGIEMYTMGEFRPFWFDQLISNGRFFLEFFLGILTSISATWTALQLGIPGEYVLRKRVYLPTIVIFAGFLALMVYGIFNPAIDFSGVGYRPNCHMETLFYGVVPFVVLAFILRKMSPLRPMWTGILAGMASSMPVVAYMHIACIYDPKHILMWHVGPSIVFTAIVSVISLAILDRLKRSKK